ncbi:hypothetical protein EIP91_010084 [Steccherinum ochraceum]|uniref:Protein kinase domain-containing protein n=1 Tax=Steccherinum ochraceum TaxID=92696 RepID=A0A4R0S1X3_9APHY|nr:hypothetical protein EIP91_010084 [Steccherinum ochraceum]
MANANQPQIPLLHSNVLSKVKLLNVALDRSGCLQDLTFLYRRPSQSTQDNIGVNDSTLWLDEGQFPPVHRESALPHRSKEPVIFTGTLGEGTVGQGLDAVVLDVTMDAQHSSAELRMMTIPPLVAKISRGGIENARRVENDAFFYEEMESLQGIAIARYYGFFEAILPDGWVIASESWPRPEGNAEGAGVNKVAVVLLEKLGGSLHVGMDGVNLKSQLDYLYEELWALGIWHDDIRPWNILQAPSHEGALPGCQSNYNNQTYEFRLIDFGLAYKTNMTKKMYMYYSALEYAKMCKDISFEILDLGKERRDR